jgi:hypothetical protein
MSTSLAHDSIAGNVDFDDAIVPVVSLLYSRRDIASHRVSSGVNGGSSGRL